MQMWVVIVAQNDSRGHRMPTANSCEQKIEKNVWTIVQLARAGSSPVQASPVRWMFPTPRPKLPPSIDSALPEEKQTQTQWRLLVRHKKDN